MKINHNISAVVSNKHLLRTEDNLKASMERLSSGFKVNHAKDNPSGFAISNKMQSQINGLDRASQNSLDGTSVMEIADGAMGEIHAMLQRIRELAVQAGNDTNTVEDKRSIQTEIEQIKSEITRISETTEFNTKSLLDGSLNSQVYPNKEADYVERIQVSDNVEPGKYSFKINNLGDPPSETPGAGARADIPVSGLPVANDSTGLYGKEGILKINGVSCTLTKDMTNAEAYEMIRETAEIAGANIEKDDSDNYYITSQMYGSSARLEIVATDLEGNDKDDLLIFGGCDVNPHPKDANGNKVHIGKGRDPQVTLVTEDPSAFKDHPNATVTYSGNDSGNIVTITDINDFKISFLLAGGGAAGDVTLDVTDKGPMDLQIGANENQILSVKIPPTDAKSLYIDDLNVVEVGGSDRAIASVDAAISRVSEIRSKIGAYSNRLEYARASLDETSENVTGALSRIKDSDMAKEMTEYTKDNVIAQAGTSALSQANELPQMALQLLQ
ncbi:MAG: flagellin [Lachnospiraceae bacterium]|nr:flagellin [Lachnospiraceae bacterium]